VKKSQPSKRTIRLALRATALPPNHDADSYARACAGALEDTIRREGAETVLAFIMEPVGGLATGALVAPNGNVEWLCLPRFDSPSVFGAILDRDAGTFRLGPDGVAVPAARRYLPGSLILPASVQTSSAPSTRKSIAASPPRHRDEPPDDALSPVMKSMVSSWNDDVRPTWGRDPAPSSTPLPEGDTDNENECVDRKERVCQQRGTPGS